MFDGHDVVVTELTAAPVVNSSNLSTSMNYSDDAVSSSSDDGGSDSDGVWRTRMREIQGGLLAASLAQMVIGGTGLASVLLRYIGPLTMAPVITLVAVPLFNVAASYCEKNWWIAFLYVALCCRSVVIVKFSAVFTASQLPGQHLQVGADKAKLP